MSKLFSLHAVASAALATGALVSTLAPASSQGIGWSGEEVITVASVVPGVARATVQQDTATFTQCDPTGHCAIMKVDVYSRTATVGGQQQVQVLGDGILSCYNGNGNYACQSMYGYFRFFTGAGNVDVPVNCGGSAPACQPSQHFSTGWMFTVCDQVLNRYYGGDVYEQTGTGLVHTTGRTPDDYVNFLCP